MVNSRRTEQASVGELGEALRACRWHFGMAAAFSALVNLLYLAPTLYMMQVYNRVVPTGGLTTLIAISAVVIFALATLAALDVVRTRLLVRAGLRLDRLLAGKTLTRLLEAETGPGTARALRDFDLVRNAISGQGALALFDAPWTPIYLLFCFVLHPMIGLMSLSGALILFGLAVLNERDTRPRLMRSIQAANAAQQAQEAEGRQSEVIRSLGMRRPMIARQLQSRATAQGAQIEAQFTGGRYSGAIKFTRLVMQSLALGLGAYLAVRGQISVGAIIAASVLLSRSVAPIEQVVANWSNLVQAWAGWKVLQELFDKPSTFDAPRTVLPSPTGRLQAEAVSVRFNPSDDPQLKSVSFSLEPGQVLGLLGSSGAGKTTLARVLAGALKPGLGVVRLDGADYAIWDSDRLGAHIGYLPQRPTLFAGSIRDNISRFAAHGEAASPDLDALTIAAAREAGVHDMILRLPAGYDTVLGPEGSGLSAGQSQRIALARALYGDPVLLVLDEPNSSLDQEGETALLAAIGRAAARGAAVVVAAHRAGVLAAAHRLMVLRNGTVEMLGPREEVLAQLSSGAAKLKAGARS